MYRARIRMGVIIGAAAVLSAACGGSAGGSSSSGAVSASATLSSSAAGTGSSSSSESSPAASQIRTVWTQFFDGKTPAAQKVNLLQNGQRFASYINSQGSNPLAQQTSAQVSNVQVNGDSAQVTYTVLVNNQPALKDQTGTAVQDNGQWKVSDASFCTLLSLQGGAPPGCGSVPQVGSQSAAVSPSSASS